MQKLNGEEIVLVVEDDTNDAFFIKRAFQSAGIERPAHICENGRDGINYLRGEGAYADRTRFPHPHFILTDLKMPVASGFELLEWLQNHPSFQVIPTIVF